jgi:hypothetical protein
MKTNKPTDCDEGDELQKKIRQLITAFYAEAEQIPQIYWQLCGLAKAHRLGAEQFRQRLLRAGLEGSHASELKRVYGCRAEREKFLRDPQTYSWRQTLATAQDLEKRKSFPATATASDLLLAELAGQMHRAGVSRFCVGHLEFELSAAPRPATKGSV